ncbi:MAG: hypothetical protein V1936_05255 [Patescibacteria group bacterium]
MRKILPTIAALAIVLTTAIAPAFATAYKAPISYSDWKRAGNTFPGGYEGFCIAYGMLSAENKSKYKSEGEFDKFKGYGEVSEDQFFAEFQKKWSGPSGYAVSVE